MYFPLLGYLCPGFRSYLENGLFPNKPPRGLSVAKFVRLNLSPFAFPSPGACPDSIEFGGSIVALFSIRCQPSALNDVRLSMFMVAWFDPHDWQWERMFVILQPTQEVVN